MTFNQYDMAIARLLMVIKYTLLAEAKVYHSKLKSVAFENDLALLRYTEIWSLDGESKNIKLADPQLSHYYKYPELLLVDTKFCVKP